jgi:hypothetical protein
MASFSNKKQLRFVITLGTSTFKSGGFNQITIQGLRASISIDKAGGVQMSTLRAKIWGVKESDMRACTTLQWKPLEKIRNTVEVFAIDGEIETLVFAGNIVNAWGDYQSIPDVFLHIQAQSAYFAQINPAQPLSYQGAMDAAEALRQIAEQMGLHMEVNGAKAMLNDIYVANTLTEQAKEIAKAANFSLYIDDKTMAICPQYGAREQSFIPDVSPQTGLVGYPTFDGIGVSFVTLYNPAIIFGGRVNVITDIPQAQGEWNVASMSHRLECEKPNGQWFSTVRGSQGRYAIVR